MIDRTSQALALAAAPHATTPVASRPGASAPAPAAHPFAELLQQNRDAARAADARVVDASTQSRHAPTADGTAAEKAKARANAAPAAPASSATAGSPSPASADAPGATSQDPSTAAPTTTGQARAGSPGADRADKTHDDATTGGDAANDAATAAGSDADATAGKDSAGRSHGLTPADAGLVAAQRADLPAAPLGNAPPPALTLQAQDAGILAASTPDGAAPGGKADGVGLPKGASDASATGADAGPDAIRHDAASDSAAVVADAAIAAGGFAATLAESSHSPATSSHGGQGADALAASALQAAPALPASTVANGVASASLPTPLHSPAFAAALGVQVSVFAKDGVQRAELHLNPADMGPVSIRITLDGTQARVDFGADTAATRQAIEAGLPQLASAMRDAGFTLAGGGVSQHSGSGSSSSDDGSDRGGGRSTATRVSATGTARLGAAAEQRARRPGQPGLDLYA